MYTSPVSIRVSTHMLDLTESVKTLFSVEVFEIRDISGPGPVAGDTAVTVILDGWLKGRVLGGEDLRRLRLYGGEREEVCRREEN